MTNNVLQEALPELPKKREMLNQTEFAADPKGLDMYPWGRSSKQTIPHRCCNRVLHARKCHPPRVTTKRPRDF